VVKGVRAEPWGRLNGEKGNNGQKTVKKEEQNEGGFVGTFHEQHQ